MINYLENEVKPISTNIQEFAWASKPAMKSKLNQNKCLIAKIVD